MKYLALFVLIFIAAFIIVEFVIFAEALKKIMESFSGAANLQGIYVAAGLFLILIVLIYFIKKFKVK